LCRQPGVQGIGDGPGGFLPSSVSRLAVDFSDFPLNLVELAEELERLAGRGVRDFWALHARSREAVARVLG